MKNFYLGMDIGTESVGMACTDENYELLRAKGKDLWSVRLFDEAKDASERRGKRTARRRLQRRKQRIEFLQGVFAPFMEDATFFLRLNNSAFYREDKDGKLLNTRFSLFADEGYTDIDFHKDYPTVFHLRKALIEGTANKVDLRHYYLALHHIVKYRGHFLFDGDNVSEINDIKRLFRDFNECVRNLELDVDLQLSEDKAEEFKDISMERSGANDRKKKCVDLFNAKTPEKKEWIALLLGVKASPKKLFGEQYYERYKEEGSFSFKGLEDEKFEALSDVFDKEHYELLVAARAIYNCTLFERVLAGSNNISEAMVSLYEKHEKDLKLLKKFVKENYTEKITVSTGKGKNSAGEKEVSTYYKIFRSRSEKANYVNYVGCNVTNNKTEQASGKCKTEEFYKFLKDTLGKEAKDQKTLDYILSEIENETFLPKILNADNGLFPHQINGMEMDAILRNLIKNYPAFNEKGEDGYTPAEKIKKIFLFKIPYYVGPLNASGENGWIVRKEGRNEKITPWNFDDVVDKAKCNNEFIRRMTNKCTYLHSKDVLPKGSMYYQAFDTLNQINKLKLNGEIISVALKQEIFQNLYLKKKKVSARQISNYLVETGRCTKEESKNILGGFDVATDLKVSMSSYVTFKEKLGDIVDSNPEIFENIILWHTLNTDKSLVVELIKENYGEIPQITENITWLKGLTSFKEFGRLSKELLCDLPVDTDTSTGEVYNVLNRLYNTTCNFNQLLFGEGSHLQQAIEDENSGRTEEITYKDVEELYVSPMVRRGIWQALTMADEYVQAVGRAPDKIFIEVTREDGVKGDNGRKASRKNKILELYKGLKNDCNDIEELTRELNHEDMTDSKLRSERLYLYFMQLGRCAYTGNRIDLSQLSSNRYDVDHIIPQSMTKDDSLDNKVLVERKKNAEKTNHYPLPQGFTNQQPFWRILRDKELMSAEKYSRLTRVNPLGDNDFREFVNRQLVVTNQTVKAVAELLKSKYEPFGTKIVYSKAGNVDDFKQKFYIVKCRETNDLHHARDAYLNVVVGNIYDTKFTSNHAYFYTDKEDVQRGYNLDRIYFWKINGAWSGYEDVIRIKKIVSKCSMQVTRYSYTDKGAFYGETIFRKDNKSVSYPKKDSFPYNIKDDNGLYKYGGYSNVECSYFVALEYTHGAKRKKVVLGLPVMTEYLIKGDIEKIKDYFEEVEGLKDVKIIVPKIKKNTLVSYNGYLGYIVGASDNRILFSNAVQWFSSNEDDRYVNAIFKLADMNKKGMITDVEKEREQFVIHTNRFKEKKVVVNNEKNLQLYQTILKQIDKKVYQAIPAFKTLKQIMEKSEGLFASKSVFLQTQCLINIVRYLRRGNSQGVDLSELKESKKTCALRVGYNITDVDFTIIHQSPCGLIERKQKV